MTNASFFRSTRPARRCRTRMLSSTLLLAALAAGCTSDPAETPEGETGGTVVIVVPAEPPTLLPPLTNATQAVAVYSVLFDHLADIGDSLVVDNDVGFRPRLAERWTWARDSMSIAFHVNPRARWHDGRPVRAADVRFTFDVYTDPAVGSTDASSLSNIDSVSVPDSMTAVFWYKRRSPQQFFDPAYRLLILPEHLLGATPRSELAASAFSRNPVGTGRFRFVRWDAGQRLEVRADTENYRGRAKLDRVIWSFTKDPSSAAIQLVSGDADFFEMIRQDNLEQVASNKDLKLVPYPSLEYGFLQFNLRSAEGTRAPHPLFADRELRRALTIAIDRARLAQNVFDTLGQVAVGPVPRALFPQWSSLRQLPYDAPRARQLLDSLGWTDADGDGVRTRGGVPLEFSILVPGSSAARRRYAVLLQEQLKQVGVRVRIEEMDFNTFLTRLGERRFDAVIHSSIPSPGNSSVRAAWGIAGARAGGRSNAGSYESAAFDAAVDAALTTLDPARRQAHWTTAYQTIVDDAPAVWLYEPRLVAGAHRRLNVVGVRADGWWHGVADWSIARGQRIARDRSGIGG